MMEIFQKIPNPTNLVRDVSNEEELIEKLKKQYKDPMHGWMAYKLLSYIFATNRSTIRKLEPHE